MHQSDALAEREESATAIQQHNGFQNQYRTTSIALQCVTNRMSFNFSALTSLLVGPPGKQRVRASQTLLMLIVYLLFAVVQHVEVLFGLIDPAESWRLTGFNLVVATLFYLLIRSGWNQKLSVEPSLTVPQMLFGLTSLAWSYAITGQSRGAVMSIMMLVLLYGMFALRPAQARHLALLGFGMLSSVMGYKALLSSQPYDPRVELVHFVFATIVTGGVAALAGRFAQMRQHLSDQKAALANALEHIQALATRDALTGLLNRRAMLEQLDRQSKEQERRGTTMCLAMFDLDHFKRINDSMGHAMGDRVLKAFARAAQEQLRGGDLLARWGGEEFLLMMPDTSMEQALHCVQRIHSALPTANFDEVSADFGLTFSAGLATCKGADDVESAIDRADKAMYQAKAGGRNTTVPAVEGA